MHVIYARNVNEAYVKGLEHLLTHGDKQQTRAGECWVAPTPVTTVYYRPWERILWNADRNANPFFHLAESLWMLGGHNDATWLDQFVGDFSKRFAEEGGLQHGAYGYRWRCHFDVEGGGRPALPDQLETIVALIKANPLDRRIVLTMWDPVADLAMDKRDIPCNTHVYFRVREERLNHYTVGQALPDSSVVINRFLDMTVCCRSNDIVWGAYGANAVHFSVLHEYVAARVGVSMGLYYQISNNYHGYVNTIPAQEAPWIDLYEDENVVPARIVTAPKEIDVDLITFFDTWKFDWGGTLQFANEFLGNTARPLLKLYARRNEITDEELAEWPGKTDWDYACKYWLMRRLAKRRKMQNV